MEPKAAELASNRDVLTLSLTKVIPSNLTPEFLKHWTPKSDKSVA